ASAALAQDQPSPAAQDLMDDFRAELARGEDIVVELGAMAARDQYLRSVFIPRMQQAASEADRQAYIVGTLDVFERIDGGNTARLKEIMADMTWPELAAISPDAANNAFLIV